MILGLTVVLTGIVRRLETNVEDEVRAAGRWSTPAEKEGAKVGRLFYAFPLLVWGAAAILPAYWQLG